MPPSSSLVKPAAHVDEFRPRDRLKLHRAPSERGPSRRENDPRLRELQARVLASLVESGYAALAFIGCDVEPNRVILRGSVPSYHLKQLAQVYALRVEGVGRIENRLEVLGRSPV
jgi:osmotically-inducible protein OsmY